MRQRLLNDIVCMRGGDGHSDCYHQQSATLFMMGIRWRFKMLTQNRLKELLFWDGEKFIWISGYRKWQIAGSNHKGYISIRIDGKSYLEHRLVWLWYKGNFSDFHIDHIDRNKKNNSIFNLREVTNAQNHQNQGIRSNNTSGITGIYYRKDCNKWRSMIKINGKIIHLGYFDKKSCAISARKNAEKLYHPFQA